MVKNLSNDFIIPSISSSNSHMQFLNRLLNDIKDNIQFKKYTFTKSK